MFNFILLSLQGSHMEDVHFVSSVLIVIEDSMLQAISRDTCYAIVLRDLFNAKYARKVRTLILLVLVLSLKLASNIKQI